MAASTAHFTIPKIHDNVDGWGPANVPEKFKDIPYAPFNKSDKLGKAADWTGDQNKFGHKAYQGRYNQPGTPVATVFTFAHNNDEDFQTVEGKAPKPKFGGPARRYGPVRGGIQRGQAQQRGRGGAAQRGGARQNQPQRRFPTQRRFGQTAYDVAKRPRDFSIEVRSDWTIVTNIDFPTLTKVSYNPEEPETLGTYGALHYYDKSYDRITTKSERPLEKIDITVKPTTFEDPIIQKLAMDEAGNVFATDTILSFLMTATKSVHSWDLIVTRVGTKLFFDKRDNSTFDYLTVNETTTEQIYLDDRDGINSQTALSQEATAINQSFATQVVKNGKTYQLEEELDGENTGYVYRRWTLANDVTLVARCEIDGIKETSTSSEFLAIRALNEIDPKVSGFDWRQKLETHRGAILATELKHNSAKLARWSAQALLAGVDSILIGYVSRQQVKDNAHHVILGTQFYKPKDFANQINANVKHMWGVLQHIIDACIRLPEGKYILLKDPNKPQLVLYEVPQDAFEEPAEGDDASQGLDAE